jgi:arylsulfatase A-like enzyme
MISFRWLGIALVTILSVNSGYSQTTAKPNVVVILTDDQGWGDLSLHGNPNLSTPNIDAMARDGAEVVNFYVCAVCSPTRAEFLTGRYHPRMGVHSTSTGGERFNADEQTIAEFFRDAGYATAAYGKWHSGMQYPYHPNARGFEDFYGFCSGHWGNYFSPMLEHNGRLVQGNGFLVDDLTTRAIEFIDEHRNQPFFVYLPLNTPHSPMQVPDPYWEKFENKTIVPDPAPENQKRQNLTHTRAALAMCENIDANVGRLIDHLEELKIADNTIVVYFCDNGPNGSRFNGGLRGRKGSTFEGGLRSPCLIRYPQKVQGGTKVNQIAAAIDLLPTLADFAGIAPAPTKPLDGISIAPLLHGEQIDWSDRKIFSVWNNKVTVRTERFRKQLGGPLHDIASDPRERTDLAEEKPKVAARLEKAMQQWVAETKPRSSRDPETRPFNLGHPDAIFTQLPARDATPHGKIARSNRFPNCTFMTDWTNTEDQITWELEVLGKGKYEVEMYYACPDSSVGTVLELALGDEIIQASIEQANESPLSGMQDDRFKRVEGYVKDWKPMKLGVIELKPGPATLTLRASKMTGPEVADMRLLLFRKLP